MTKEQDERVFELIKELMGLISHDRDSVAVLGVFTTKPTNSDMFNRHRFIHGSAQQVARVIEILTNEFEQGKNKLYCVDCGKLFNNLITQADSDNQQPKAQPKPRCLPCGHIECHGDDCPFL